MRPTYLRPAFTIPGLRSVPWEKDERFAGEIQGETPSVGRFHLARHATGPAHATDQVRLLAVACIRLVGWCYSEPPESVWEIVEGLDIHATVPGNGFAELLCIKHWLCKDVCELYARGHTAICEHPDCLCREFAVVEPFHGFGFSRKFSAIEEDFVNLVSCNSLQYFLKSPLRLLQ